MTELYLTDGRTVEHKHVGVKASGWVKCYDSIQGESGNQPENLNHYPAHVIENIKGDVTYESPHGKF